MTAAGPVIMILAAIAMSAAQAQSGVPAASATSSATAIVSIQTGAQDSTAPPANPDPNTDKDGALSIFPQHQWGRFWVSGQANFIEQGHGDFRALFSGPNSLRSKAEHAGSRIFTLYTATRLSDSSDVVFHLEEASGLGISNSLGLAGYTNIDVVRIPGEGSPLSTAPYVARLIFRYVVPLGHEVEETEPGPFGALKTLPKRRIEFRIGRFALADFVDVNAVGSDSHFQFLNWTLVNNGAWDYSADTRGYTWGAYAEYHDVHWSLRFVEALMPKIANGIDLDWNLRRAHGQNLELELRPKIFAKRDTTIRLLGYRNVADMGNYREVIHAFLTHQTATPDIVASRQQGRTKNGVGLNLQQDLTSILRGFLRLGYNDGHNESFAFTEDDQTVSFGADLRGEPWGRKNDKIGAAFVSNGLSRDHREYLALGGLGFLLGDGSLIYGRENIVESYYTAHVWRGVFAALDLQHINNPGYNRARGPAWVPGLRLHLEF